MYLFHSISGKIVAFQIVIFIFLFENGLCKKLLKTKRQAHFNIFKCLS